MKIEKIGRKQTKSAECSSLQARPKRRRHLPKAERRQQLIDATIDSIMRRGFSETTLSHVTKTAGLSQGIVNLHFDNKDTLLVETLKHLREEFGLAWHKYLVEAGDDPAQQLKALVDVCFDRSICNKKKIAGWFAFIGEAKSRPVYRQICEAYDKEYYDAVVQVCETLTEQGNYSGFDANQVASALEALLEGLWLSIHTSPSYMDRQKARSISAVFLGQFFPKHFAGAAS